MDGTTAWPRGCIGGGAEGGESLRDWCIAQASCRREREAKGGGMREYK